MMGMSFTLLIGITIAWVDVPIMTLLQREIPAWLLGRVLSLMMGLIKVVLPLALLASGLLINLLPVVVVPLLGGGAAFGYSLFLLRRIKRSAHD